MISDGVTGIIVDTSNTEELEASILRILTDGGYGSELGRAGRERVKTEFRWQSRTERLRSVLDRFQREGAQGRSAICL